MLEEQNMTEQSQPRVMPNRIREIRVARGYTLDGLAKKIGTTNQYLSFIENGKRRLSQPWMEKIAEALACRPADLLPSDRPYNPAQSQPASPAKETSPVAEFAASDGNEATIPVYASTFNTRTGMSISLEIVELISRPEPLFRVKGGFAVYVVGETMAPAYGHGDLILVRSGKIAGPGDDVLIIMKATGEDGNWIDAYIKKIVSIDSDKVILKQWSPVQQTELSHAQFAFMYPIVGVYRK
ncbi:putative Repressor protein C [uncultured Gammaproteobacteria bacterium]